MPRQQNVYIYVSISGLKDVTLTNDGHWSDKYFTYFMMNPLINQLGIVFAQDKQMCYILDGITCILMVF